MFRRFADRVSNAVSNATAAAVSSSPSDDERVTALTSMGFRDGEARHALRVTGGDMQQATEWLLQHGTPTGTHAAATTTTMTAANHNNNEDTDIQQAIQASLEEQAQRRSKPSPPKVTSAAAKKAGRMAVERFENKGTTASTRSDVPIASHPKVQIPKQLSQHDKEDVILRCAVRIAPYPRAVDTLLRTLTTIQANPNNPKYKIIDTTTNGFQRSLNSPGVVDFLKAMNFHPQYDQPKTLKLALIDPATFFLGISALEQVQQTSPEYANKKVLMQFDKDVEIALASADSDMNEAIKRAEYMSKCPSESSTSTGSQMTIELGSDIKISRKFDGDDTLRDVLHWLGGHASVIPANLENGEWHLVDRNHPDALPYNNISEVLDKTLQYIGCWPSGRLAIVPTLPHDTSDGTRSTIVSSYRGLGAGPVEHIKKG
jgi:hypothetical protein